MEGNAVTFRVIGSCVRVTVSADSGKLKRYKQRTVKAMDEIQFMLKKNKVILKKI